VHYAGERIRRALQGQDAARVLVDEEKLVPQRREALAIPARARL